MSESQSDQQNEPQTQSEQKVDWRVRFLRSRATAWMELCRPNTGAWMQLSAALMVIAAAHGSMEWKQPFVYCGMIVAFTYTVILINQALDAKIDGRSRLMHPIPRGRMTPRAVLIAAVAPFALGCTIGFATDWRVAVIGLAIVATASLYSFAWRGSVLGVAAWALVGVLLPAGAIQMVDTVFPSSHVIWVIPIGGLTGAGAFMLYKLPDYELDDIDGSRSVLHWLGVDTAVAMTWAVLAAGMALSAASINLSGGSLAWLLGPLLYLILVGLFCIWMLMRRLSEFRLRFQRYLILPLLPLLLICWLGAAAGA